jgi:hypothetical protein
VNVFQASPHPPLKCSGAPVSWQNHRLEADGCHWHAGHRIRSFRVDSSCCRLTSNTPGGSAGGVPR